MSIICDHAVTRRFTRGFTGCVDPSSCDPTAHGNIAEIELCRKCGAMRRTNVNAGHRESGAWKPTRHAEAMRDMRVPVFGDHGVLCDYETGEPVRLASVSEKIEARGGLVLAEDFYIDGEYQTGRRYVVVHRHE